MKLDQLRGRLHAAGFDGTTLTPGPGPLTDGVHYLAVPGRQAILTWQKLRESADAIGCYPLVLGPMEEVGELERHGHFEEPPASIVSQATALGVDPQKWAWLSDRLRDLDAGEERPDADWPDDATPQSGFSLPYDLLTHEPHPRVAIALLPALDGWRAPAYLRFGGWNDCPHPAEHVAAFRSWFERFGAEPVGIGQDVVEMRVARPPADRDTALALAREQYGYCADIVDQGVGSLTALAASLLDAESWYFWWD